jgi:hypothetical protein
MFWSALMFIFFFYFLLYRKKYSMELKPLPDSCCEGPPGNYLEAFFLSTRAEPLSHLEINWTVCQFIYLFLDRFFHHRQKRESAHLTKAGGFC